MDRNHGLAFRRLKLLRNSLFLSLSFSLSLSLSKSDNESRERQNHWQTRVEATERRGRKRKRKRSRKSNYSTPFVHSRSPSIKDNCINLFPIRRRNSRILRANYVIKRPRASCFLRGITSLDRIPPGRGEEGKEPSTGFLSFALSSPLLRSAL